MHPHKRLFCSPAGVSRCDGDERGGAQRQSGWTGDQRSLFAVPVILLSLPEGQWGQLQVSTGTSAYLEELHAWSGSFLCLCFWVLRGPIGHLAGTTQTQTYHLLALCLSQSCVEQILHRLGRRCTVHGLTETSWVYDSFELHSYKTDNFYMNNVKRKKCT